MNKWLLRALVAVGLMAPLALVAQTVSQISANSVVRVANGPGGSDNWVTVDTIGNRSQFTTKSGSGAATSTAVGGTLYWVSTAPTTWAVTLPLNPTDGEIVTLVTDTTLTTMVTVTAGTGDTLHATYNSQTLTALIPVRFQYQLSTRAWFRLI